MTIESIFSSNSASGAGGNAIPAGLDLMTSIELLLVQDYDNQLQSMGKQIKGTTKAKQASREQIQKFQKLLTGENGSMKFGDDYSVKELRGKDAILIPGAEPEINAINSSMSEYGVDPNGNLTEKTTTEFGTLTGYVRTSNGGWYVPKENIENLVESMKLKLDSLNEQSETMSLQLQSLTNQRKIAFETVSNLVNKGHEGLSTITRNIKS